uniref:Uncharacterized protein n=1 Tax=Trichuris muris TaxID=70415 RepID=A0A5S6Q332_TRIMR
MLYDLKLDHISFPQKPTPTTTTTTSQIPAVTPVLPPPPALPSAAKSALRHPRPNVHAPTPTIQRPRSNSSAGASARDPVAAPARDHARAPAGAADRTAACVPTCAYARAQTPPRPPASAHTNAYPHPHHTSSYFIQHPSSQDPRPSSFVHLPSSLFHRPKCYTDNACQNLESNLCPHKCCTHHFNRSAIRPNS